MWKFAFRWGIAFLTSLFVLKKNYQEQEYLGPQEPWDSMTLGEKLSHAQNIPLRELAVLITITYGVVNITKSFVDYKKR